MFRFRTLAVAATLAAVSAASFAQDDQHKAHHPAGAASAAMPAPATGKPAGMPDMAMMDKHMKTMQAMHDKMASAKTQAEREALMAEHMKLMQEGMSMMGGMAPGKAPADDGEAHGHDAVDDADDDGPHAHVACRAGQVTFVRA